MYGQILSARQMETYPMFYNGAKHALVFYVRFSNHCFYEDVTIYNYVLPVNIR